MYKAIRERFFSGLRNGKFEPWTNEEIDSLLEEKVLSKEPLMELEPRDAEVVGLFRRELGGDINSNLFYFATTEDIPNGIEVLRRFIREPHFFLAPTSRNPSLDEKDHKKELKTFDEDRKSTRLNS